MGTSHSRIVIPAVCGRYPSEHYEDQLMPAFVATPTVDSKSFVRLINLKTAVAIHRPGLDPSTTSGSAQAVFDALTQRVKSPFALSSLRSERIEGLRPYQLPFLGSTLKNSLFHAFAQRAPNQRASARRHEGESAESRLNPGRLTCSPQPVPAVQPTGGLLHTPDVAPWLYL